MADWRAELAAELAGVEAAGGRRRIRSLGGATGPEVILEGRRLILAASNDYLSLAGDERLRLAAGRAAQEWGAGAGASRLVCGTLALNQELEEALARFKGTEAALVFSSGYLANLGLLAALAGPGDAIFSDELNHASIVDGCRLSRAEVFVFRHRSVDHLAELIGKADGFRRRLVVSDGLFSMDGDLAPLPELSSLCRRHDAVLVLDDAHATGVLGPSGKGSLDHFGLAGEDVVQIGTLSKAIGSLGGFVAGPQVLIDYLINASRPFIYTTALPPPVLGAALAGLEIAQAEPWRRQELAEKAAWLRAQLARQGWSVPGDPSPIIPVVLGSNQAALGAAERLLEKEIWAPAIRPPSVPAGSARLRVSLSAGHTWDQVKRIAAALGEA